MKALKLFLISLTALSIAACAFDKNTNADDKGEADDNARLSSKFESIKGLYRGTVRGVNGNSDQQVDLTLYIVQVPNGKNSQGETKFTPALRAYYRRTDTVTTDLILEGRYFDSSVPATLSISNFAGQASDPQALSAQFTVGAGTLEGPVTTSAGVLGYASFQLIDRNAGGPAQDDTDVENARREAIFKPVLGTFDGAMTPNDPRDSKPFSFTIRLFVDKRKDATGRYMSILRARMHRLDSPESSDLYMDVDYSPNKTPARITLSATGWVQDRSSAFPAYVIVGSIENNVITGTFTGNGYDGKVRLKK